MKVAVVGASGMAGTPIAGELERRGHDVRRLSRSSPTHPVDLLTGAGLDAALDGCCAVVDASNAGPAARAARAVLVDGGRRLLAAEERAGVGHHVCLSIVGIDRVPMGYYRVKVEQEGIVRAGGLPFSIVRATQFHGLVAGAFAALARLRVLPRVEAPLQPVDPAEVASLVAERVGSGPDGLVTVAGPEISSIAELARTWRDHTGSRALLAPVPLLGAAGRGLRAGGLTDSAPDRRGEITFAQWLARPEPRRSPGAGPAAT